MAGGGKGSGERRWNRWSWWGLRLGFQVVVVVVEVEENGKFEILKNMLREGFGVNLKSREFRYSINGFQVRLV